MILCVNRQGSRTVPQPDVPAGAWLASGRVRNVELRPGLNPSKIILVLFKIKDAEGDHPWEVVAVVCCCQSRH